MPTKRDWLNPVGSNDTGHVKTYTYYRKKDNEVYGDIDIADCSRKINLEFAAYNQQDAENRLKKINIIRKHLDMVEKVLLKYLEDKKK